MNTRAFIAVVATVACVAGPRAITAEPTAAELASSLQEKYTRIRDFSASFVQSYAGGVLKRKLSDERGMLWVKKPGLMRWDYKTPDEKQFVSNGTKTFFYVPADKQVFVASLPADDSVSTRILFLAGKGDLARDFTPSLMASSAGVPPGAKALKLVPKTAQADFEWLILFVDPASLALRGLATTDAQGGTSTFLFNNVKENIGISDTVFQFKMPRGVDVIADGR